MMNFELRILNYLRNYIRVDTDFILRRQFVSIGLSIIVNSRVYFVWVGMSDSSLTTQDKIKDK